MLFSEFKNLSNSDIEKHLYYLANNYYNGESLIADTDWDMMYEWYQNKNPGSSFFETQPFALTLGNNKVKLPVYMGSLSKVKPETSEYSRFLKTDYDLVISEKLDGISILIQYQKGKMKLYTRGNGYHGQDVSFIRPFLNLPIMKQNLIVRGELLLPKKYVSDSNLRNIISGQVNSKDPNPLILKQSKFIAYSIPNSKLSSWVQFETLSKIGFEIPHRILLKNSDLSSVEFSDVLIDWRCKSKYEIDGLVLSYNVYEEIKNGENPKYSKAFKTILQDQKAQTEVLNIHWNITKDNYLKPVLEVEAVTIGKCKIQRVTGNNARFLVQHGIGIGSKLEIIRSGDVIPKVNKVLTQRKTHFPNINYTWSSNEVDLIAEDSNSNLPQLLLHFVRTLGIKYVNSSICQKLVNYGICDLDSFIGIDIMYLESLPGFGDKQSKKIYQSIQQGLHQSTLISLIVATNQLGRNFGSSRLELIFKNISLERLWLQETNLIKDLTQINGISTKLATQFIENWSNFKVYVSKNPQIKSLLNEKIQEFSKQEQGENQLLKGITFSFTGFRNQKLQDKIELLGGKTINSISKNLSYLVVPNNLEKRTTKIDNAEKKGVTIINIDDLIEKYSLQ